MLGVSQHSLAAARERLTDRVDATGFDELADQLFAVVRLLGREAGLRGVLANSGVPAPRKTALVSSLFRERLDDLTLDVLDDAVQASWSDPRDFVDALEILGTTAFFLVAEREGTLDVVEEELFRFGRAVTANPRLRAALTGLLNQVVTDSPGRAVTDAIGQLTELAAEHRRHVVAEVRAAAPLQSHQERRLAELLSQAYGREAQLQVTVDPNLLGGVVVRIGEDVIDGSVTHRIGQARQRLGRL